MKYQELKIAACQMEVRPGHPDLNTKSILAFIEEAKNAGDDIVIFPELAVPGYLLSDEWENQAFLFDCYNYNREIVRASKDIVVVWGNVDIAKDRVGEDGRMRRFNTAFVAQNGEMKGKLYKTLHPDYREFDDDRYFYSSQKLARDQNMQLKDFLKPLDLDIKGERRRLGITLCEDAWSEDYTVSPVEMILNNGAEFIVNISCSPWTKGKKHKRHEMIRQRLKDHPAPFIFVNNTGIQNNGKNIFVFDGNTCFYNPDNSLQKSAAAFVDQLLRASIFSEESQVQKYPPLSEKQHHKELLKALLFGIKKFFELIAAEKVVIGISGGIDSSLSAYLLSRSLGPGKVYAVNMPSRFNSKVTGELARRIAETLEINYVEVPIQEAFEFTCEQLENTVFERLNGSGNRENLQLDTLDKENIQARDRGSRLLAGIASALDAVFVCNSNKTETTIGYATLYGDIDGALAPIADLFKTEVYALCAYINSIEEKKIFPDKLFEIPASAELSEEQDIEKGKGDPLNFKYHDKLFRAFVEYRLDPEDILRMYLDGSLQEELNLEEGTLQEYFKCHKSFIEDLEEKWEGFKINYFKRIQAPPILALSKRAFGFDLRESQMGVHFTRKYKEMKAGLLEEA